MSVNASQRLKGRVAVVTGGAQGIGFGIAAAAGGGRRSTGHRRHQPKEARATRPSDIDGCRRHRQRLCRRYRRRCRGSPRLRPMSTPQHGRCEILVNNAAISDGTGIEKMTMARYHEVIRVNQDGAVRMCLAFVPLLKKAGDGRRILNIASIMGVRGWPNAIPYSTAKGAIVNFTRALAADLAPHGIMVNALAPGFVNTPMSI